ncbi:uncharacterized protein TNCT_415481 [Trichonephila clavata]|uniref:Uncharacterized protein n=1 Tax=Trichonephila clavata TaxID=2740835 RepID=A0A8X6LP86_TRICU|nr:uncharacterized protein TNCT_415481 [Trichonephila clavata]
MQFRKKTIRILVLFLYFDPESANFARNKTWEYLLIFLLVLNFISPLLLAVLYVYLTRDEEGVIEYWAMGYEFQEKRCGMITTFIGVYSYFAVYVEYPCLCTLSVCVLVHRYVLLLFQFDESLRKMEFSMFPTKCFRVVNKYTEIEKKILLLKDTLSAPMFIMLLGSFFNIYTALSNTLKDDVPSYYWIELGSNASTGTVIIFSLTFCCSRIPENMLKIKTTLGSLIDKHQFKYQNGNEEMKCLKRVEKKDVIYMSAGDVVDFRISFLLTAFGTLLTYSILIVNLN